MELTEDDWKSQEADDFALAIAIALALALAFAIAFTLAVDPVSKITVWYYVFRFPGAYAHYRRRMKINE